MPSCTVPAMVCATFGALSHSCWMTVWNYFDQPKILFVLWIPEYLRCTTKFNVCMGSNHINEFAEQFDQLLLDFGRYIGFVQLLNANAIGHHDQMSRSYSRMSER
ncbi:hypothetical protein BDV33DRAFT_184811 [Aspergillus novoparasiticus]|uniref:Uncharacterized protein n=1 Tax=Aspergillus novoparasiticus TaxID=986946 RepID=A0A5N6E781_9EURO|nr:hypothetical protein BDV33DRAFT_184811 [Aspergillus novoparasiticus]